MIVSASRRTDIPAFFGDWFLNRVREGYALVPNPYNPKRFTRVPLTPDAAELVVFWTKNAGPFLPALDELNRRGFRYCFEYTLTGYGPDIEPGLGDKREAKETLLLLADRLGPDRVDWRYDPILVDRAHPAAWHEERFGALCREIGPRVGRCIVSFLTLYRSLGKRFSEVPPEDKARLASLIGRTATESRLPVFACACEEDLSAFGIGRAACIDPDRASRLIGRPVPAGKDAGQRPLCRCARSVDIGVYDTCRHGCAYCYAMQSPARRARLAAQYSADAPSLAGFPPPDAEIYVPSG